MKNLTLLLGLLLLVPGCVRSLQPFYTDAQLFYDPTVNGTWTNDKKEDTLVIAGDADHKMYKVAYTDKDNKTGHFEIHLAKLGNTTIADIAPAEPVFSASEGNDTYSGMLLPTHTCMLLTYNAQSIRLRGMSYDWFKKYVKDHADAIKFEKIDNSDDNLLLTAPTEQLQAFVQKNLTTPDAWGDWSEFHWVSATTKP